MLSNAMLIRTFRYLHIFCSLESFILCLYIFVSLKAGTINDISNGKKSCMNKGFIVYTRVCACVCTCRCVYFDKDK